MNPRPRGWIFPVLALLISTVALAGDQSIVVPDLDTSSFTLRAAEEVSVLICPACDGAPMSQAMLYGGGTVDATIEVLVLDFLGNPMHGFPHEDIWLEVPGLALALGGKNADLDADANGYTEFSLPKCGGGSAKDQVVEVIINGDPIRQAPITTLNFNSPDINGDGIVNLADVRAYASIYWSGYNYAADFYWDGFLDLKDVAILAQHLGHTNP